LRRHARCARRLDLERPVDNQLLLDCIDLAEQAPTGGNLGSRRWIIVREQRVKDQLGELYRETALPFMSAAAERLQGSGHPSEKVMSSAAYLAEHLAEVPAIVIPTVISRHDGGGRPGLFDSVIQAAWSFCLALRARGLGTTWVTAALQDTAKVKEILGIPEYMTEIVLLPVAYTKGTEFKRAPRHPARAITYFDRFGTTTERGPSDELRFEDGPGAIAEVDIAASPATVWSLVSDLNLSARFSNEFVGAEWASDNRGFGPCSTGATNTPRSASGRSRASSTPATNPARSGGAPLTSTTPERDGDSISNPERAALACGSPTSWDPDRPARPWPSRTTRTRRRGCCAAASTKSTATCSRPLTA
jgi:nitroreductase